MQLRAQLAGFTLLLAVMLTLAACALPRPAPPSPLRPPAESRRGVVPTRAVAPEVIKEIESVARPAAQPTPPPVPAPPPLEMAPAAATVTRRIIYEADLELVVQDTEDVVRQVTGIAEELGGYIADANVYRVNDSMEGRLTVRVPQERFEEALDRFRSLAVRVERESRRTDDVTDQFVDLEARLKNLETTEEELRELLTEVRKRTQRASDVMEVYRQLADVRGQIERIKGQMQMLEQLTSLATIRVALRPYELSQPVSTGWDPRVTLRRAWIALLGALQWLMDLAIYLVVVVVPVGIIILLPTGLLIYFIWWRVRR